MDKMLRFVVLAAFIGVVSATPTPVRTFRWGREIDLNTNCNQTLSGSGRFTTPNYPAYYPLSTSCFYSLTVPVGQKVMLTLGPFNTEPCCDYVMIYDGPSTQSQTLARIAGNFQSRSIMSTGNTMTVNFYSDLTVAYSGFEAVFSPAN